MKKRIILILVIFIMLINLINIGAVPRRDAEDIKETIDKYFEFKYLSLSKLEFQKELDVICKRSEDKIDPLDLLEVDINWRKGQELDYSFTDYKYNIDYLKLKVIGNKATFKLKENHKIRYKCIGSRYSILNGLVHTINLKKYNNVWYIMDDLYENDVINEYKEYRSSNKDEFKKRYELKEIKKINKEMKIRSVDEKMFGEEKKEEKNNNMRGDFIKKFYNRENAAAYGLKYSLTPNNKYANYESLGGDCTNFVSQCLLAGGIPQDNNGIYKWYWHSDYNRWPSWTSARELRRYLLNNNGSEKNFGVKATESNFENVEIGDVVQYVNPTHSMIITGYLYDEEYREDTYKRKNDVLISQHSVKGIGWLKDYPLKAKPTEKGRFYIKINGYYN